jgi:Ca2+-binding RTX toxin-like protein
MPTPVKWSAADFELANGESPEGEPWLAAAPGGRFSLFFFESFTVPSAHTDVENRLYDATGAVITLNSTTIATTTSERQPANAFLPDGREIFVWTEAPVAGGGDLQDVYAAIYIDDSLVSIPRFLVSGGASSQLDPVVAAGKDGFMIALNDGSVAGGSLVLKFYDLAGGVLNTVTNADSPQGVSQADAGTYRDVEACALANGNYAVVWHDSTGQEIFARVFTTTGVAVTGPFEIEPASPGASLPDITALADGRFLVTFFQNVQKTVRGRIFEADGTASTDPFTITTDGANNQNQQPQSAALQDGRFVTVWKNIAGNIEGQVMFADGTPDGVPFAVNSDGAGNKGRPVVATLADGRFAVSWESGSGATATIFSTIFDPRETALNRGASGLADDWIGTGLADKVYFGAGDDIMRAAEGNDTVFGEAGEDSLLGEDGNDKLYGGNDDDGLEGGIGDDSLNGELGNDFLRGDAGSDTLNGGAGNDELRGSGAGDVLNGGTGNDVLLGELGLDVLNGGNGDDTLDGGADKDTLNGDANNDALSGGADNDTLRGGTGNDRQAGGVGNDVHQGGAGLDTFVFFDDTEGNDRIDDWVAADDEIEIDASAFGGGLAAGPLAANRLVVGSAPTATQAFGQFLYNTTNGQLSWDIDGTGATAAVAITRLLNGGVAVGTLAVGDFDIVA